MDISISIIIPLYNKSNYLPDCLSAFKCQLSPGDEIIVVDDKSTDDGLMLAQHIVPEQFGKVIPLPNNSGPSAARNIGARHANGTHLLFFDADDLPSPSLLKALRKAIQAYPLKEFFSFGISVAARGGTMDFESVNCEKLMITLFPLHEFSKAYLSGVILCTASSTCIARDAYFKSGGFDEAIRYCEDPELWSRLSSVYQLVWIKEVLAYYRDTSNSLSYGHRGKPGSVNLFVDSLLRLNANFGGAYIKQAKLVLVKNFVFSKAANATAGSVRRQISTYPSILGQFTFLTLFALSFLPAKFFILLLKLIQKIRS